MRKKGGGRRGRENGNVGGNVGVVCDVWGVKVCVWCVMCGV